VSEEVAMANPNQELETALVARAIKRENHRPALAEDRDTARSCQELRTILIEEGTAICEKLAKLASVDCAQTRVYFTDAQLPKRFVDFFKERRGFTVLGYVRAWMETSGSDRVFVEDDSRYAGFFFQFA
jgi:hypothetical protein